MLGQSINSIASIVCNVQNTSAQQTGTVKNKFPSAYISFPLSLSVYVCFCLLISLCVCLHFHLPFFQIMCLQVSSLCSCFQEPRPITHIS